MKEKRGAFCVAQCVGLTLISLLGLSLSLGSEAEGTARLLPLSGIWIPGGAGLFLLYRNLLRDGKGFARLSLWVLAAFFAGIMTLGQSFAAVGTMELVTGGILAMGKAFLFWAGRVPFYFALMAWALKALTRAETGEGGKAPAYLASPWLWPGASMLLFLCWLPWLIGVFPGVVSNDSVTQLMEIYGVQPLANGHPVFQTFLIWLCCQTRPLWGPDGAILLYCLVQGILMAALLGYMVMLCLRSGAPRWLGWVSLGFYALCPIFPLYAFCVGKDTSFAMAVLFFSLMVWQAVETKETPRPRHVIGLCVSGALVVLLRNPGVYLASLTLIAFLLVNIPFASVKRRQIEGPGTKSLVGMQGAKPLRLPVPVLVPALALAVVLCAYGLLHWLAIPLLEVGPMLETEEYSVPLQQVARAAASRPEVLTEAEWRVLDGVLDSSALKESYNGELSDPVKLLWKSGAAREEKQAFFRLWVSLGLRCPDTYFSAFFHNAYGYLTPGYVSVIKPTFLIGKQKRTDALDPYFAFSVSPHSEGLQGAMNSLLGMPLPRLLLAPGLYGCIALFAAVVLLPKGERGKRASRRLLIPAVPAVFTLLGCLLSAVNGYFRYAMPLYFAAPLLLLLCALSHKEEQAK